MNPIQGVLRVLSFCVVVTLTAGRSEAQTPPAGIMPLDDSLTHGVTAGFNVDFIDTQSDSNPSALPDPNHQGMGSNDWQCV